MRQPPMAISISNGRTRVALLLAFAAVAVTVGLLLEPSTSQASSRHLSARVAAANTACNSYLTSIQPTTGSPSANAASVVDAYPTTAGNLEAWLLNFDPLANSSAYQAIPASEFVSACVLQGAWTFPAQNSQGSNNVSYEIVMIAPDGTATPLMWGPSEIANSSPPLVGS